MKYVDRAFAMTLTAFTLGSIAGAVAVFSIPPFEGFVATLLTVRLLAPVQTAAGFGNTVLILLIFSNNCVPVLLSYLYPIILGRIRWTPPLFSATMRRLLAAYSLLAGFLVGFLNLGATLAWARINGGWMLVDRLVATSWLHGPLEFLFILLAVAEPLRLTSGMERGGELVERRNEDWKLFCFCLIGLLVSALVEVLARA